MLNSNRIRSFPVGRSSSRVGIHFPTRRDAWQREGTITVRANTVDCNAWYFNVSSAHNCIRTRSLVTKGTLPANKLNKAQTSPHFAIRNVQQGNAILFSWVRTPPPRFRRSNSIGYGPQELFQKFNFVWKPRREQDPVLLSKIHHTHGIAHFALPSRHALPTWPI